MRESPVITVGRNREEVAEPEGQADPGGASPVKHFSGNTVLFPQVKLILSAIPPGRAARCARWDSSQAVPPRAGTQTFTPWIDPIKILLLPDPHSSFLLPMQVSQWVFQPNAEAFAIPLAPLSPLAARPYMVSQSQNLLILVWCFPFWLWMLGNLVETAT